VWMRGVYILRRGDVWWGIKEAGLQKTDLAGLLGWDFKRVYDYTNGTSALPVDVRLTAIRQSPLACSL
jgi:hypothetical protein